MRPVLHQRHDRQPQGRALRASLDRAPRHVDHRARHLRPLGALGHAAGRADVPRQQLVPALCRGDHRPEAGHLRRQQGRTRICRLFNEEGVTHSAGVPDRLAEHDRPCRGHGRRPGQTAHDHRRRIVGAAGDHPLVPRARDPGQPSVGHDRDVADRHGRGAAGELGLDERAKSRSTISSRPGRSMFGVELRIVDDEGKVLPRDGESSGRLQTRGAGRGPRAISRRTRIASTRTIGSTPAISPSSIPTTRCASPTAPRT